MHTFRLLSAPVSKQLWLARHLPKQVNSWKLHRETSPVSGLEMQYSAFLTCRACRLCGYHWLLQVIILMTSLTLSAEGYLDNPTF